MNALDDGICIDGKILLELDVKREAGQATPSNDDLLERMSSQAFEGEQRSHYAVMIFVVQSSGLGLPGHGASGTVHGSRRPISRNLEIAL